MRVSASFLVLFLSLAACTEKPTTIKISGNRKVTVGDASKFTVTRYSVRKDEARVAGQDRIQYHLDVRGAEPIKVEEVSDSPSEKCKPLDRHVESHGETKDIFNRKILFWRSNDSQIDVMIDCYPRMFRFTSSERVLDVKLIVQDMDDPGALDTLALTVRR